jgi:hypothetical protein
MSDIYKPGWQSREYRQLSRAHRAAISLEVDRRFREQTGVGRRLDPTSPRDLELRRAWLRIRDAVMNKREEEIYKEVEDMRRDSVLTSIPGEMEWERWNQAAELLETWFERPPATAPKYSAPVTKIIKMDWVLQFARAKAVYDEIIKEKIWTNGASQKRMAEILKKKPRAAGQLWGDLSKPVTEVDEEWINARPVVSGWSVDALTGALGAFELQVAIAGKVRSIGGGEFEVSIEEVGIYVKDSFDFNGDQFLGVWGYRDDPIHNSDFRKWRADNHLGGDFMVFSDVKRVRLNPPDLVKGQL